MIYNKDKGWLRMRVLPCVALACVAGMTVTGCGPKKDYGRSEAARSLYERCLSTTMLYTDSLRDARDSATVLRLSACLDYELARINYVFPPDTDLDVSEGENDTLTNLTDKFVLLRDSLLYRFAHPLVLRPDSLPADTTSEPAVLAPKVQ